VEQPDELSSGRKRGIGVAGLEMVGTEYRAREEEMFRELELFNV
jgi:hypothetical protein